MKKMILAAFALTAFAANTYAQNATTAATGATTPQAQTQTQDAAEKKTQIAASALPEAVQKTLATDAYKDWKVVTAWQVTGAKEYYVLDVQKGEEKKTLKLNKEGKEA